MDLKQAEETKAKSSIEEPPELELKELPSHLKYAFLEESDKLPAITWKISDIKGIDPRFYTHKILMEEDYKPAVQSQRMVYPKIHDVIKKEVIKLLDAGMIYPISDSPCMMAIFHDMIEKTMEVFMDDFSVFGDSFSSCLTNLDKMLKRCEDTNLVLNWEKRHFMCKEGIVLGHKISKSRIEVNRAKVDVIDKLHHPTTVKGVRSFLGHAGSENLAADHLSRLENPHKDVLENKDINENFPLETLRSLSRSRTQWAIISDRGTHFYNDQFTRVMIKYGVTHHLATAYHPQMSGQVEVSNCRLKRILERTVGENCASWSDKLDDALWAFRTTFKTPIGCTPYKLKLQLNELNELRDQAYENSLIYKERTKKLHDSKIKNRIFNVGDQVLLFNSRLKIFSGKLKTRWSGPFTITQVFPYGTVDLSQPDGPNFKVNGHRVKHYFGGDVPSKEVDREPETITDQVLTGSTNNVPPLVVQSSPASTSFSTISSSKMLEVTKDTVQPSTENIQPPVAQTQIPIYEPVVTPKPKPTIPYPSRVNKQKHREKDDNLALKFVEIFRNLHFELSFADALLHMPKFALKFKSLLNNKKKLFDLATTPVNENCSAVILKKLPEKLRDPDKFLIPSDFPEFDECLTLADLGASINLMPLSIWKKLSLTDLTSTQMILELADRSTTRPAGIVEDVFVKVGKFHFPTDFVVVDYVVDPRDPLSLARPFLRTKRALIDVYGEELTLCVDDEAITFKVGQTLKYSYNDAESINRVDVIDVACEEYIQEEEIEACLTSKLIPPRIDDTDLDLEGDIRLLKELLNNDPSLSPLLLKELNVEEIKTVKSSIDEPPEL
nr:reverse transcriptase domain-containing protein [Tanacetum cinerariifolium]